MKKILFSLFALASLFLFRYSYSYAKMPNLPEAAQDNPPETSGVYSVKGRPDLTLRVISHPARNNRPGKPSPTPTPTLNCQLSDPESSEVDETAGWHLPENFNYVINSSSVPASIGSQYLNEISSKSFYVWTDAINNAVKLTNIGETIQTRAKLDGLNIVSWGRASSGTLGVTYIWYYNNGTAAEVDTIMNKAYKWTWSDPDFWNGGVCAYENTYDAQNIMTHEFGHWFGVDDNYSGSFADNTMYGYGDVTETKKDTLTFGDEMAIESIYLK